MTKNTLKARPAYVLFCDGSAKDSALGWGALLWRAGESQVMTFSSGGTAQQGRTAFSEIAEWNAAAAALELLGPKKRAVWLLTDCMSVATFLNGLAQDEAKTVDSFIERVGTKLVFRLAQLARAFPELKVLKIKGHAGSFGNETVDKLASTGRVNPQTGKKVLPLAEELRVELKTLTSTSSADYSFIVPSDAPNMHDKAMAARKRGKPVHKLSGERITELTRGLRFELTFSERQTLVAEAETMKRKAGLMLKKTPGQRKARGVALRRADAHAKISAKKLLTLKRKNAALQLAKSPE